VSPSVIIGIIAAALIAGALFLFGCAATAKCSAEAVAPYVPRIEAALQAHDSAALAELAIEVGHDVFVCAMREHAKASSKTPPVDAGVDGGK